MFQVFNCLTTEHDWRLVALALGVCLLASLTAIVLFHRAQVKHGQARLIWLGVAGCAAGFGIWATHFIAMLAYSPGVPVGYDLGLTVLSLLVAALLTGLGLAAAVYIDAVWAPALGGAIVGAGISTMHYIGMAAIELPGHIAWTTHLMLASIPLGIAFSMLALLIATRQRDSRATIAAAATLTVAIAILHFTAMAAVVVVADPLESLSPFALSSGSLALAIANGAVAVLGLSCMACVADRMLRRRDRRLATAVDNMTQGLVMFDADERMVVCNGRYIEMYRLSPEVVKPGCTLTDIIQHRIATGSLHRDADEYRAHLLTAMARRETLSWVVETEDGRAISVTNRPLPTGDWVGMHEDITDQRNAKRELERTKEFLNKVIENVPVTIAVKTSDLRYLLINRVAEQHYGISREQMIGKTSADVFPDHVATMIAEHDRAALRSGHEMFSDVHPIRTPHGKNLIVTTKRVPLRGPDGDPEYLLMLIEDVTERKRAEARIEYLAHHDPLTNLPNRAAFTECLESTLERAEAANEKFALLCIDLDRFKEVNDVFGHSAGDALLQEAARRLHAAAGAAFVARPGGDEFTVIMANDGQPASASELAERLLACTTEVIELDGPRLRFGLSIGVAIYPDDGRDAKTLLANADAALYRAKAEGRGSIRFFASDMDRRLRDRRAMQHDLRSAVDRDELKLHYQPQALIDGTILGFEALLRWHHPTRGLVSPGQFVPLAEESALIIAIGEWVLREACREAASWPNALQIAVNLSPVQFKHGDLAGLVHSVLLETGLAAHRLELEITEGALIDDFPRAVAILRRIKALGVKIAMDDFGTGYSSLSYLQAFPFDKMKIDRSFIANLTENPQSAAIIRAMIGLARGLGLPVLAEGVETEEQLRFLLHESCDEVQGYLIGHPAVIDDFADLVGCGTPAEARIALAS
jgi:diguanylate cyclase (GGDEF)-like protein/PAS domain S-box-containing protein